MKYATPKVILEFAREESNKKSRTRRVEQAEFLFERYGQEADAGIVRLIRQACDNWAQDHN